MESSLGSIPLTQASNVEAGQKIYFNTYWYGGTPGGSNDPNRKDTFMTLYDSEFNYLDHNDDGASFGISPYSGILILANPIFDVFIFFVIIDRYAVCSFDLI